MQYKKTKQTHTSTYRSLSCNKIRYTKLR